MAADEELEELTAVPENDALRRSPSLGAHVKAEMHLISGKMHQIEHNLHSHVSHARDLALDTFKDSMHLRGSAKERLELHMAKIASDGEASMLWSVLRSQLDPGCKNEYFLPAPDCIRVNFASDSKEPKEDLVANMKMGMLVFNLIGDDAIAHRKLLKVDEELRFIYMMDTKALPIISYSAEKTKEAPRMAPQHLVGHPLENITHIYTLDDAHYICVQHDIDHPLMTHNNVVILLIDSTHGEVMPLDEEIPALQRLLVFISPEDQRLRDTITACKAFVAGNKDVSTAAPPRVNEIGLTFDDDVLDRDAEGFKCDISFRNSEALRTVAVLSEMCKDSLNIGGVIPKLKEELLPMDLARVCFVLRESVALRLTTTGLAPTTLFKKGISLWVNDESTITTAVPEEMNLADAREEVSTQYSIAKENATYSGEVYYTEASTRAILVSLQAMYSVENDFVQLTNHVTDAGDSYGTAGPSEGGKPTEFAVTEQPQDDEEEEIELPEDKFRCFKCGFVGSVDKPVCMCCQSPRDSQAETALMTSRSAMLSARSARTPMTSARTPMTTARTEGSIDDPTGSMAGNVSARSGFDMQGLDDAPQPPEIADGIALPADTPQANELAEIDPKYACGHDSDHLHDFHPTENVHTDPRFPTPGGDHEHRNAENMLACVGACSTPRPANQEKNGKDGKDCTVQ